MLALTLEETVAQEPISPDRIARLERRVTALTLISLLSLVAAAVLAFLVVKEPAPPTELILEDGKSRTTLSAGKLDLSYGDSVSLQMTPDGLLAQLNEQKIDLRLGPDGGKILMVGSRKNLIVELLGDDKSAKLTMRGRAETVYISADDGVAGVRLNDKVGAEASLVTGARERPVLYLEALDSHSSLLEAGAPLQSEAPTAQEDDPGAAKGKPGSESGDQKAR